MFENLPLKARPALDLPRETRATCDRCVMTSPHWPQEARDPGPFSPILKCCTYEPFIPNFSVGRLWTESAVVGAVFENALRVGTLTPLGLIPRKGAVEEFGRNHESRCVFLSEQATCAIWRERPSVCRSYFCVSDQGPRGQEAWREAERLGNEAEWALAHEALWTLGFTDDDHGFAEWKGREREFFLECAQRTFTPFAHEGLTS